MGSDSSVGKVIESKLHYLLLLRTAARGVHSDRRWPVGTVKVKQPEA